MVVKNIDDLVSYVTEKVQESLLEDVALNIKSTEHEMVYKKVYSVYSSPVAYQRRDYEDGLSDPENMIATLNGTTLTVTNITRPNFSYNDNDSYETETLRHLKYTAGYYAADGCFIHYPFDLVRLVEYGDAAAGGENQYTHKHSSRPEGPTFLEPRPFIAETRKEVARGKQHVNGLRYGLKKAGLKVRKG